MHVLGSFIFGLPTDTPQTFEATADLAQRAGVSFAQFVMLTPFPGTVDFAKWERDTLGYLLPIPGDLAALELRAFVARASGVRADKEPRTTRIELRVTS